MAKDSYSGQAAKERRSSMGHWASFMKGAGSAALTSGIIVGSLFYIEKGCSVLNDSYSMKHVARYVESEKKITGTVLNELALRAPSSNYALLIQTDEGSKKVIHVTSNDTELPVSSRSLDLLIEPGSRIQFPRGNLQNAYLFGKSFEYSWDTYFTDDTKIGCKRVSRIEILDSK